MRARRRAWATKVIIFSVTALAVSFSFSSPAHAGLISLLGGIFGADQVAASGSNLNSQNMPLLSAAVNRDPDPIKGGGDITIVGGTALLPETGPLGTVADLTDNRRSGSDQISIYIVRSGDTLSQIAQMFDVSVNTIVWANNISRGAIHEGQELLILPISGVQYTVKKGDTLASIAKKFKGDADEIAQFNSISIDSKLAVGETIIIPDGEITTPSPSRGGRLITGGVSTNGYYLAPLASYRRTQGIHGYNGVDLAGSCGAPILAAAAGEVIVSRDYGWNGGYGRYVVIAHGNGTQTLYAHNSENIVAGGQRVVQGQVIAYEGSSGRSTGCHVHFEVRGARNPF